MKTRVEYEALIRKIRTAAVDLGMWSEYSEETSVAVRHGAETWLLTLSDQPYAESGLTLGVGGDPALRAARGHRGWLAVDVLEGPQRPFNRELQSLLVELLDEDCAGVYFPQQSRLIDPRPSLKTVLATDIEGDVERLNGQEVYFLARPRPQLTPQRARALRRLLRDARRGPLTMRVLREIGLAREVVEVITDGRAAETNRIRGRLNQATRLEPQREPGEVFEFGIENVIDYDPVPNSSIFPARGFPP